MLDAKFRYCTFREKSMYHHRNPCSCCSPSLSVLYSALAVTARATTCSTFMRKSTEHMADTIACQTDRRPNSEGLTPGPSQCAVFNFFLMRAEEQGLRCGNRLFHSKYNTVTVIFNYSQQWPRGKSLLCKQGHDRTYMLFNSLQLSDSVYLLAHNITAFYVMQTDQSFSL